jgi:hypothetical protein
MNISTENLLSNSYYQVKLGEPIFLHVFLLRVFLSSIYISNNTLPPGSLVMTVRNEVLARILLLGKLIFNSFFQVNSGVTILLHVFLLRAFFPAPNSQNYESPWFPWTKLLEIRFTQEYLHLVPYF